MPNRGDMETTSRDNFKLAIVVILATCFALSLGDALIKQQSASFAIWQIFAMRSLIALPFLVYLLRIRSRDLPILPRHFGWTLARSLILVLMWICYFAALPHIALAVAAAAYYTLPIFITLLAAIFLREKITISGWLAIVIGFSGTLLILQPQADDFDAYALLPLISAVCYACAMTLTRGKCQHEKPIVLSLWLNISFVAVGVVALCGLYLWDPTAETVALNSFLLGAWTPMGLDEWRIMGILAIAILIGSVGAAYAYQNGPASTIASFDFSYVGFATIWGFLLFDEIPGPLVSVGIILIVIAGGIAARGKSG